MGIEVVNEPAIGTAEGAAHVRSAWKLFGGFIKASAEKHRVPAELILAMLANQSRNFDANVAEKEPYVQLNPPKGQVIGEGESVGLMRILLSTARDLMGDQSITKGWLQVPKNNIDVGAAYLAKYRSQTQFDPPKVLANWMVGGLKSTENNRWRMLAYGADIDRFVRLFNNAVTLFRSETNPPRISFSYCIP